MILSPPRKDISQLIIVQQTIKRITRPNIPENIQILVTTSPEQWDTKENGEIIFSHDVIL